MRHRSLPELLVAVSVLSLLLLAVAAGLPGPAPGSVPRASSDLRALLRLARVEAVRRRADCRLILDLAARSAEVRDAHGARLHGTTLPASLRFERPDAGPAISLGPSGAAARYQIAFDRFGRPSSGAADIVWFGGDHYRRLHIAADGNIFAQRWRKAAWRPES
jgi:Tfp pilus assembly protein FimT